MLTDLLEKMHISFPTPNCKLQTIEHDSLWEHTCCYSISISIHSGFEKKPWSSSSSKGGKSLVLNKGKQ